MAVLKGVPELCLKSTIGVDLETQGTGNVECISQHLRTSSFGGLARLCQAVQMPTGRSRGATGLAL